MNWLITSYGAWIPALGASSIAFLRLPNRAQSVCSADSSGLSREVFTDDIIYERPGYEPLVGIERVIKFYRAERVIVSGRHYLENMVLNEHAGAC